MSLRFKRVSGKAGHHIKALYILSVCLGLVIENPLWPQAAKTECRFPCSQIIHCLDRKEGSSVRSLLWAVRPSGAGQCPASPSSCSTSSSLTGLTTRSGPPQAVYVPVVCTRQLCADTYYRPLPNAFWLHVCFQMPDEQIRMLAAPFTQINSIWKDIIYEHCIHFPFNQPLMVTVVLPLDSPISWSLWNTMAPNTGRHIMNQHTTNS